MVIRSSRSEPQSAPALVFVDCIELLHEKEMHKSKTAVWGGLTNSCEKKRSIKQRRKGKIYPFECSVPKNSKER